MTPVHSSGFHLGRLCPQGTVMLSGDMCGCHDRRAGMLLHPPQCPGRPRESDPTLNVRSTGWVVGILCEYVSDRAQAPRSGPGWPGGGWGRGMHSSLDPVTPHCRLASPGKDCSQPCPRWVPGLVSSTFSGAVFQHFSSFAAYGGALTHPGAQREGRGSVLPTGMANDLHLLTD